MRRNNISQLIHQNPDKPSISIVRRKNATDKPASQPVPDGKSEQYLGQFISEFVEIRNHIATHHAELLQNEMTPSVKEEIKSILDVLIIDTFKKYKLSASRINSIREYLLQSMTEFGPITDLYNMPGVTDIHIKRYDHVTIRREGRLESTAVRFASESEVEELIKKLLRMCDSNSTRSISWTVPFVNGRLSDGTRFNAVISPSSIKGPSLSIRKHRGGFFSEETHITRGTFTASMAACMRRLVEGRCNILVVGGGGTGKTEILRLLGTYMLPTLNIDTIEDIDELELYKVHPNVRPLEFRTVHNETMVGTAYDLIRKVSLRSDVDVVIVGEILDDITLDNTLDCMSIGQPGSMASLHADDAELGLERCTAMLSRVMTNLSEHSLMKRLATTLDVIITVKRDQHDGKRRISRISQINGLSNGKIETEDLYRYRSGVGHFRTKHSLNARIRNKLIDNGITLDFEIEGNSEGDHDDR